ncbi:MAG: Slp family lipoprotein [Candidatus Thiodiazotropha sp.]|jgi:outer membrane lipoprotein
MRSITLLLLVAMLGCSSLPTLPQADRSRSPHQVSQEGLGDPGQKLQWGGILIGIRADELEILAYPLDRDGRPQTERKSEGRFLARITDSDMAGELSIGQQVTATGQILSIQNGRVGKAEYRFPVMACEDLAVWPEPGRAHTRPRVHFGFGASSGGGGYGSIGIGIGF